MKFRKKGANLLKKIRIRPDGVLWLTLLLLFMRSYVPAYLSAVLVHELGHLLFLRFSGKKIGRIELGISGLTIISDGINSYRTQFWVSLAGPLFSVIFFLLFRSVFPTASLLSLLLGAVNLLPLSELDGYGIMSAVLFSKFSLTAAERVLTVCDVLSLGVLCTVSVFSLVVTRCNVSALIFTACIFWKLFFEKGSVKTLHSGRR